MEISIEQIEYLLREQKKLVIERLLGSSSYYNSTNTASTSSSLTIDEDRFRELGEKADLPKDIKILKSYGIK